jgi:hypothetical protein
LAELNGYVRPVGGGSLTHLNQVAGVIGIDAGSNGMPAFLGNAFDHFAHFTIAQQEYAHELSV